MSDTTLASMAPDLPAQFALSPVQPISADLAIYGGIFARKHILPDAGMYVPQHAHAYDHLSLIAQGGMRAWCDGVFIGDFMGPTTVRIGAHTKHTFLSLVPNTIFYCLHSIDRFEEEDHGELPMDGAEERPVMGPVDADGISFQLEPLAIAKRDADPLMVEHAKLIGEDPEMRHEKNWPLMLKLDALGVLRCLTARCNGRILGYLLSIVAPSLENTQRREAMHVSFCTSPDVPGLGLKLQRASIESLRELGVDQVELRAGVRGLGPRMGTIYRRLGAVPNGESWLLRFDEETV